MLVTHSYYHSTRWIQKERRFHDPEQNDYLRSVTSIALGPLSPFVTTNSTLSPS